MTVLATDVCRRCEGEGMVTQTGFSLNPNSGIRTPDPQEAYDVPCPACKGTGEPQTVLLVDLDRTVLVSLQPDGTATVATREHASATWGPPVELTETT